MSARPARPHTLEFGVELFNQGEFYEAHEVLEDVWRAADESDKKFFQGLIQAAVALHHYSKGNVVGACSLLARAERNLRLCRSVVQGVCLDELVPVLTLWRDALLAGEAPPPPPRIRIEC